MNHNMEIRMVLLKTKEALWVADEFLVGFVPKQV